MDLNAAIRAKVNEISERLDDDCNMQCGVSCASQGYDDITRGLLAALDLHKSNGSEWPECVACSFNGALDGTECGILASWPCPTVLAIAKAFEIEPLRSA